MTKNVSTNTLDFLENLLKILKFERKVINGIRYKFGKEYFKLMIKKWFLDNNEVVI